jgi:hypothetical protein
VEPDLEKAVYAAADDPVAETAALAATLAAERGAQVPGQTTLLSPAEALAAQAAQAAVAGGNGSGSGNGNGSGSGSGRRVGKAQIKQPNAPDPDALRPVVKEQHEKVGRNEPCWCGSGKKFKFCHGAA